ncbi:integrase core domain-containing protein, partial [Yoonia sp.]|uniref:integrase core domain-containing protein n=1 Tax=Yoonia sp. TaxID=2212373 RepID=UPI0025FF9C05
PPRYAALQITPSPKFPHSATVRHEWLDQYSIDSVEEAQDDATKWLWTYNNDRPNIGIGGITPAMKLKMAA